MENKVTRVWPDFENELKAIDPRIAVVQNPNRPKLANIKIDGVDVCAIPAFEIRENTDPTFTIETFNGRIDRHRSKTEAIDLVKHTLRLIENKDNADAFFGRNGY